MPDQPAERDDCCLCPEDYERRVHLSACWGGWGWWRGSRGRGRAGRDVVWICRRGASHSRQGAESCHICPLLHGAASHAHRHRHRHRWQPRASAGGPSTLPPAFAPPLCWDDQGQWGWCEEQCSVWPSWGSPVGRGCWHTAHLHNPCKCVKTAAAWILPLVDRPVCWSTLKMYSCPACSGTLMTCLYGV